MVTPHSEYSNPQKVILLEIHFNEHDESSINVWIGNSHGVNDMV